MVKRTPQVLTLFYYIMIGLVLIGAVEYFKYSTKIHYDWFHCTPVTEPLGKGSSAIKLFAVGGPSCDKRGELKTIVKRITRDYDINDQHVSFCIKENLNVPHKHYPVHEDKGEPGYVAYVGYNSDYETIEEMCSDATILHI